MLKESGRSSEEVARILNVSVASVATMLARAKAKGYQIVGIIPDSQLGLLNSVLEDSQDE
jgi:DNA-directed RNA polymerase specialized sigma24 family protein